MKEKTRTTLENIIAGITAAALVFILGYKGVQELELMHYRSKAEKTAHELSEKYDVSKPELSIDRSGGKYGNFYNVSKINLSSDTILHNTSIDEWRLALIHEFGHHLYVKKADKNKLKRLYLESFSLEMTRTFKEGKFEEIPDDFGHPEDGMDELFASAFLIREYGFIEKYKQKYFPNFTEEQKRLAEEIFEEVGR